MKIFIYCKYILNIYKIYIVCIIYVDIKFSIILKKLIFLRIHEFKIFHGADTNAHRKLEGYIVRIWTCASLAFDNIPRRIMELCTTINYNRKVTWIYVFTSCK